ncbi:hypothetical protein B0H19DRAFT_1267990 [Mycena capillaripes]|nr:hypothetical protein B0H19DRAFT_1267990 [Mycena capillaripes]
MSTPKVSQTVLTLNGGTGGSGGDGVQGGAGGTGEGPRLFENMAVDKMNATINVNFLAPGNLIPHSDIIPESPRNLHAGNSYNRSNAGRRERRAVSVPRKRERRMPSRGPQSTAAHRKDPFIRPDSNLLSPGNLINHRDISELRQDLKPGRNIYIPSNTAYRDRLIYSVQPDLSFLAAGDLIIHRDIIRELPQELRHDGAIYVRSYIDHPRSTGDIFRNPSARNDGSQTLNHGEQFLD